MHHFAQLAVIDISKIARKNCVNFVMMDYKNDIHDDWIRRNIPMSCFYFRKSHLTNHLPS